MKSLFKLCLLLLFPLISFGQEFGESRLGINLGATNYIMDTNFLSSKSATGVTLGLAFGYPLNFDSLELIAEINLNNHRVKLVSRETLLGDPRDVNYFLQNINAAVLLHYKVHETDDFTFGVYAGPTFAIGYSYMSNNDGGFVLIDPLGLEARYLDIDGFNSTPGYNFFATLGVSAQYDDFMASLRYNKGLTYPYRNIPVFSPFQELTGKDNYWAFIITYFF